ncbi:hypothetical protein [Streptomyces sp. SID11385]|uniref:hypothetical protein n=1 Tax=Streptomyces sp. SID11385 TaxID=2706031 RepID=UPI0013C5F566|nr:hypothetical protein [Streptomyces sp. SID11385]NEA38759.1 hypothetical protein [Streptomyces sp. SID11385]
MEAGPVGRVLRAAMFAAVSVTLAATGHVLMSATPLPLWVLAVAFVSLALPGWWFAARERGPWLVTALAVATQGVLHSAFTAAQSALGPAGGPPGGTTTAALTASPYENLCSIDAGGPVSAGGGAGGADLMAGMDHSGMAGMDHSAMGHMAGMDHSGSLAPMAHMGHDMGGMSSTGMLAAHVLAALVCGIWLAHGERAVFQVLRAVTGWLRAPLHLLRTAPLPAPRRRLRPRKGLSDRLPQGLRCARALERRGPPGVLAAP